MAVGVCKLTGKTGDFVKCHLIPKALTRPASRGLPFNQLGLDGRVITRWDSWYDPEIVIREGEDVLEKIDTAAIEELKRHKLIWSSWGPIQRITVPHKIPSTTAGVIMLADLNSKLIRMFALSLLWRASVTSRFEFQDVRLPKRDLERIRRLLLTDNAGALDFYPVTMIQMSTRGIIHNQSPMASIKINPSIMGSQPRKIKIYRFYFDGLVFHIHRPTAGDKEPPNPGPEIVGAEQRTLVATVEYQGSFEDQTLNENLLDALIRPYHSPLP